MLIDTKESQVIYLVSAAWLSKPFDCTLPHILEHCHGRCCEGTVFWPSKAFGDRCGFLGPNGCVLAEDDKPVTCMLFPIVPNKDNRLIMFHRSMFKKGMCRGAFKKGPPLIDSQRAGLVYVFGQAQYDRVRAAVMAGRDSYFSCPQEMHQELLREAALENTNIKPIPRSQY